MGKSTHKKVDQGNGQHRQRERSLKLDRRDEGESRSKEKDRMGGTHGRRYRLLGSSKLPQFEIVLLHSAQIVYLLLKTSAFAQQYIAALVLYSFHTSFQVAVRETGRLSTEGHYEGTDIFNLVLETDDHA